MELFLYCVLLFVFFYLFTYFYSKALFPHWIALPAGALGLLAYSFPVGAKVWSIREEIERKELTRCFLSIVFQMDRKHRVSSFLSDEVHR